MSTLPWVTFVENIWSKIPKNYDITYLDWYDVIIIDNVKNDAKCPWSMAQPTKELYISLKIMQWRIK